MSITALFKRFRLHVASTTLATVLLGCSCLNLDPFLFKEEKVTSYSLDTYRGERECSDAIDSLGPLAADAYHELTLISGGNLVYAAFLHTDSICDPSDTLICYFHGTGPHNDYYWPRIRLLYETGFAVLSIDYRGYGRSGGTPTEEGIYEDGRTALRRIRTHLGNPHVVIVGFSLGSLVACEIAANNPDDRTIALILEAPIGSVETLVQDGSYLNLPGSYVTTFTGSPVEKIKSVTLPLLWLHGTNDETLPRATNGLPVWNNYQGPRSCSYTAAGAGHATIPQIMGYAAYSAALRDFIRSRANPLLSCR